MAAPAAVSDTVVVGVDTHEDVHVAVALDGVGRRLGAVEVATDTGGYERLLVWAQAFGQVIMTGIEGTSSFGAGLSRFLTANGVTVHEVARPDRQRRRRLGKTDTVDAEAAARAVLAEDVIGQPKAGTGTIEMIRALRVARRSADQQRTGAVNQMRSLLVTAPDALRGQLRGMATRQLLNTAKAFRPGSLDDPTAATKTALRSLARRVAHLETEIADLDADLATLTEQAAPALLAVKGVGVQTAAMLLTAAGDNPGRIRHERAFARLCGVAPVDASSGKQERHRLNRGGNREANCALHLIVCSRLAYDERSRAYLAKRISEGKTRREAIRCLKRYAARELFPLIAPIVLDNP
jgi:transposase